MTAEIKKYIRKVARVRIEMQENYVKQYLDITGFDIKDLTLVERPFMGGGCEFFMARKEDVRDHE